MAKAVDFYPIVITGKIYTREMVDEYFRKRGTCCKITHIPATNPREEFHGGNLEIKGS
jgi:hypothetical protein